LDFKEKYGNITFYGLTLAIIAVSFLHFSAVYYYFLNPDHAIHILMAANFKFPHDLYFWGQDRLGSLIPLLAHLIMKITGMNAVWAVSIADYLILTTGFFCISTLFKKSVTKLILAVFWFFPPLNFLDFLMIAQPFGIEMSLLAAAICFFNKIESSQPVSKRIFTVSVVSVILIISFWVSDLTIISVILFIVFPLLSYYKGNDERLSIRLKKKNIFKEPVLYVTLFWIVAGFLFIAFAKSHADRDTRYTAQMFNNLHLILLTVKNIFYQTADILKFKYEQNIYLGFFGWFSIIALIAITYQAIKNRSLPNSNKWFWFFLLQALLSLSAIVVSHWVFRNGISRRYFVPVYISSVLTALLLIESFGKKQRINITVLLFATAISGLLSSVVHIYYPKKQKAKYEVMKEFGKLGKAGIIAEYWNSYITAIAAPDMITATPNDGSYVRNKAMADSVFTQPRIYIIKDSWLDTFPEKIEQFGYTLKKVNNPFELGGGNLCEYKKVKTRKIFTYGDLKSSSEKIISDKNSSNSLIISADSSMRYKYLVYGPYITLNKGKYKVFFNLRSAKNSEHRKAAILEVTAGYGKTKIATQEIFQTDFPDTTGYHPFELAFEINSLVKNIEFRVYYVGKENLRFDYLELRQTD